MNYSIGKLVNDMEYIIIPNDKIETVCLSVGIRVGSNDENNRINGISHLLEHMLFKGNKMFKSKIDLYIALDNIGAVYNAYTDKNITSFYAKCHYSNLKSLINIFSSLICEPYVEEADLITEKKIVIEEINNAKEEAFDIIYNRFYTLLYKDHPISKRIAGDPSNINDITRDDVLSHLRQFYTSNNMVISIAGKIEGDVATLLENSSFAKAPHGVEHKFRDIITINTNVTSIDLVHRGFKQIFLGITFPTKGLFDKDKFAIKLIDLILNGSMSSRLFLELREKQGLVYSIMTDVSNFEEAGIYYLITSFEPKTDKINQVLSALFMEFNKIVNTKITEIELNRWKNYIKSAYVLELENTTEICDYYTRQMLFFRNDISEFHQLLKNFELVTVEDIQRVAGELFNWKKMKVVLVGDYSEKSKLGNEIYQTIVNSFEPKPENNHN
jgi:predicted Zn-dependent peptidase